MKPIRLNETTSAKLVRVVLKNAFPACRFRVTCQRGAGASSVRVFWTDGPTPARVGALVHPFAMGHFDGSTDSYEYLSGEARLLLVDGVTYERGVRYVFVERVVSPRLANRCIAQIGASLGLEAPLPVAVEMGYVAGTGYKLLSTLDERFVGETGENWNTLIRLASANRMEFAR